MTRSRIGQAEVSLEASTAKFKKGTQEAARNVNTFKARVNKSLDSVNKAFKGLQFAIAAVASAAVIRGVKSLTDAWNTQQKAVLSLNASLKTTGRFSEEATKRLQEAASALQQVTTAGDEAILSATSAFADLAKSLNASELQASQKAIIAIADTFMNGNLEQAALLLGKSIGSTTNALSRYGIQLDANASQSDKLNAVLEQTNALFEKSKLLAMSNEGQLKQLSNAWGDLQESVGRVITEIFLSENQLGSLKKTIEDVTRALDENRKAFVILGRSVVFIGKLFSRLVTTVGLSVSAIFSGILDQNARFILDMLNQVNRTIEQLNAISPIKLGSIPTGDLEQFINDGATARLAKAALAEFTGIATDFQAIFADAGKKSAEAFQQSFSDTINKSAGGVSAGLRGAKAPTAASAASVNNGPAPVPDSVLPGLRNPELPALRQMNSLYREAAQRQATLNQAVRDFGQSFQNDISFALRNGELSFRSFAVTAIDSLSQVALSANNLSAIFGSIFGSKTAKSIGGKFLGFIPGFANGGFPTPNAPAIVGERGPELIVPQGKTRVFNNSDTQRMLGGGGPVTQNFYIQATDPQTFKAQLEREAVTIGSIGLQFTQRAYNRRGQTGPLDQ